MSIALKKSIQVRDGILAAMDAGAALVNFGSMVSGQFAQDSIPATRLYNKSIRPGDFVLACLGLETDGNFHLSSTVISGNAGTGNVTPTSQIVFGLHNFGPSTVDPPATTFSYIVLRANAQ